MAQCTVYHNKNPQTNAHIPYLLDVQSNLLASLATCVVVPLYSVATFDHKALKILTPILTINNLPYVMMTPQLAGVSKKELGQEVADFTDCREAIMAALDFLITGI